MGGHFSKLEVAEIGNCLVDVTCGQREKDGEDRGRGRLGVRQISTKYDEMGKDRD